MKKVVKFAAWSAGLLPLLLGAQPSQYDNLPTENGIAAIVEGKIITHEE